MEKTIGSCGSCGYPLASSYEGETITCPNCLITNKAIAQKITMPTWLLTLGIGLSVGILAGPAILASTEAGQRWLERKIRERTK